MAEADKAGPVTGSEGQPVSHPALRRAEALLGAIARLETRFGLHPRARRRSVDDEPQKTLEQLTADVLRSWLERPADPLDDGRLRQVRGYDPRDNLTDPRLHELLGYDPRAGGDQRDSWLRYWDGPDAALRIKREIESLETGNPAIGALSLVDRGTWAPWNPEDAAEPGPDAEVSRN